MLDLVVSFVQKLESDQIFFFFFFFFFFATMKTYFFLLIFPVFLQMWKAHESTFWGSEAKHIIRITVHLFVLIQRTSQQVS